MILPRFDVLVPETIDEACTMLTEYNEAGVRLLAGGTDLLVDLRRPIIPQHVPSGQQKESPAYLISLHKLKRLRGIKKADDGGLKIGGLTTIIEIVRSSDVRQHWTALAEGADNLGSPLVRNRGTLGGNIVNARPAADMAVPTIGLGGLLTLKSSNGTRTVSASEFAKGPGISVIEPGEILTTVYYPPPLKYSVSAYYKLANRKALEISTVGVSVWLALKEPKGPVTDVRVALGAVGPTPILAESIKEILIGQVPDEKLLVKAAQAVRGEATPIDDHRGSAWYRTEMVERLTLRLLKKVLQRIQEEK